MEPVSGSFEGSRRDTPPRTGLGAFFLSHLLPPRAAVRSSVPAPPASRGHGRPIILVPVGEGSAGIARSCTGFLRAVQGSGIVGSSGAVRTDCKVCLKGTSATQAAVAQRKRKPP